MSSATPSYQGRRYPMEIISHCVWLYFRFPLSFREVEELMLERGVIVSHETVRRRCVKFGQQYANAPAGRSPNSNSGTGCGPGRRTASGPPAPLACATFP